MTTSIVTVGVREAKKRLSELLRLVDAGEEVEIQRGGQPVARLVPVPGPRARTFGIDAGRLHVPDDFDAPLPDDVLEAFER
jgi:prevent-host-death family protein